MVCLCGVALRWMILVLNLFGKISVRAWCLGRLGVFQKLIISGICVDFALNRYVTGGGGVSGWYYFWLACQTAFVLCVEHHQTWGEGVVGSQAIRACSRVCM